ncbi:MAG: ribbon-helix-helix domain-containing protein [Spirochaetaceae bacterium]|nr:ribbon-helix-helix domain-containing protein [Spirochaetaceae bacterium]
MKTLTVKLPERLAASLEREAERAQVSKSEMVRDILDRHLSGTAVSAVDLAVDLAGCVDSGVGDLSSNRARLDGFGR